MHGLAAVSKQRKSFDSFAFLATATHFRQSASSAFKIFTPFDVLCFYRCYKSTVVNKNEPFRGSKTFVFKMKSNSYNSIPIKICNVK